MGYSIAIDGPAGAGKSTIAKRVAKEKGFIYVDTGAMYRGLALHFLDNKIDPKNTQEIAKSCAGVEVKIAYEAGNQQIYVNGKNVTKRLREEAVGNMASMSAGIQEVREALLELQRGLARTENIVMDGRDIGTFVLPEADVKVFLTASVKTRAKRRYDELLEQGVQTVTLEDVENDITKRDERDMNRSVAPLKQAEDAILVDSSDMGKEEVVNAILMLCK